MNANKQPEALRVAVIGCGTVAGYGHLPAILASDHLCVTAFVDRDRSRAVDFSQRFGGGEAFEDYREVLDRNDIDAIAVFTPPRQHCRMAIEAMEAGKHVFTEKPISHDSASAEEMVAAAKRTGRKLFVGFLLRHTRCFQKMGEVIHAGAIGRPIVFRMISFERYEREQPFYWERALQSFICETSPGIDCGSHYVDLMRWYSGAEAVRVQGVGARTHPDVPDGCFDWEAYQIEFDDGSRGFYEAGWGYSYPAERVTKEAIGPEGYVGVRSAPVTEGGEEEAETVFRPVGGEEEVLERSPWKGFDEEWEHFVRMVREDLDPYPALHDAVASMRIVEAGNRSAREGGVVLL
jgi:predicted dehydrogenase